MAKRTIIAVGEGIRYEYEAASAVSPGDYVVINSTNKALRMGTALARRGLNFAIENEIFGKGVETDYAAGDRVLVESCTPGMGVNVTIAAGAAAIAIGDQLEAAADGTLRKLTTSTTPIAVAKEAIDNSGGASKVRILAELI